MRIDGPPAHGNSDGVQNKNARIKYGNLGNITTWEITDLYIKAMVDRLVHDKYMPQAATLKKIQAQQDVTQNEVKLLLDTIKEIINRDRHVLETASEETAAQRPAIQEAIYTFVTLHERINALFMATEFNK